MWSRAFWISQNSHRGQWTGNTSPGFIQTAQETGIHTFRVDSYPYKDTTLDVKIPVSCAISDSFNADFGAFSEAFRSPQAQKEHHHSTWKVRNRGNTYLLCQNRTGRTESWPRFESKNYLNCKRPTREPCSLYRVVIYNSNNNNNIRRPDPFCIINILWKYVYSPPPKKKEYDHLGKG